MITHASANFAKTGNNRRLLAAIAALVACISCTGFGAITETDSDMTAQGDWEVTVASGDTNIATVAQSGSGKIVKKGAGTLVLTKNSTFSGGVEIQAGFLTVDPDETPDENNVIDSTALGSGAVRRRCRCALPHRRAGPAVRRVGIP